MTGILCGTNWNDSQKVNVMRMRPKTLLTKSRAVRKSHLVITLVFAEEVILAIVAENCGRLITFDQSPLSFLQN
jgi:GAF domain-containing protein